MENPSMDDEQGYPYFRKPPYLTNNSSVRKSIRTHLSTPQKDGSTVTKVYSWNAADLLIIRSHSFGTTLGERDWQAVEFYPIYKLSYVRCRKPCCWLYPIKKKNVNNPVVHCWIHPVVGYHQISGGVPLLAHHGWLDHPLKKINWGIIDVCSIYIYIYTRIHV